MSKEAEKKVEKTPEDEPQPEANSEELKALTDQLHKTFEEFKDINAEAEKQKATFGEELGGVKEQLANIEDEFTKLDVKIQRITTLPSPITEETEEERLVGSQKKAFWKFARKGINQLSPEEFKDMTVGDDTSGGYLAPPEFVQEIIKGVVEFDPVRELARIRQTTARIVQYPKRTSAGTVFWTGAETQTKQETALAYGMLNIPVHEASAVVPISNQDLEDSAFNLESEIQTDLTEQFGVGEGTAFVTGDGVARPEGLLTQPDIGEVNSGDADEITPDGLIDTFYALFEAYSQNATFLLRRASLGKVRKLKDTTNQYLWQPGIAGSQPNTILGAPYRESPAMPAEGADAFPVLFGDFARGYVIVDRLAVAFIRDDLTEAKRGVVEFIARKRVGGQVILPEAFKKMKCSV